MSSHLSLPPKQPDRLFPVHKHGKKCAHKPNSHGCNKTGGKWKKAEAWMVVRTIGSIGSKGAISTREERAPVVVGLHAVPRSASCRLYLPSQSVFTLIKQKLPNQTRKKRGRGREEGAHLIDTWRCCPYFPASFFSVFASGIYFLPALPSPFFVTSSPFHVRMMRRLDYVGRVIRDANCRPFFSQYIQHIGFKWQMKDFFLFFVDKKGGKRGVSGFCCVGYTKN